MSSEDDLPQQERVSGSVEKKAGRPDARDPLDHELQRVGTWSVLFKQALAERVGINASDLECLDLLAEIGPVTAGQLAQHTGLTTAAITGMIDRLEKGRFVQRAKDPTDRRKVVVQPLPDRLPEVGKLYASLARAVDKLRSRYSDQEQALLLDFATGVNRIFEEETLKLRDDS